MANYTTDEVQAAVSKIVRSTVRYSSGSLGERQVQTSFSDLQEAAIGVYILYFNAPYYTLLLGVTRLTDALATQVSTIASLIDAVSATKRAVTPISDLAPLANAKAALEALQSAVSSRTQGFQDIQAVPAFRQYTTNINAFIAANGSNIKGTSTDPSQAASPASPSTTASSSPTVNAVPAIVDTPAGAVAQIPGLVTLLKSQQDDIVRRVGLLSAALADFSGLNLPQIAAQGVISNAHDILSQHYNDLAAVDENTRLTNLRAVVLDLLTQQPLVQSYGAGLSPSQFVTTSGLAKAYSDGTHLSGPASVLSTKPGPYLILDTSHLLSVTVDGGTPISYPLPLGYVAELNGTLVEPFKLDSSSNSLSITFDDPNVATPFRMDINLGIGTFTADEIAAQIAPILLGTDLVIETYFSPLKLDTVMLVTGTGGNNARFTVLAGGLNGLNILVGDQVDVAGGPNRGTWTITGVDPAGLFLDTVGFAPATDVGLPGVEVQVGPAARALRLRDGNPATSLALRRAITLIRTGGTSDVGAALLGWAPGTSSRSQPVLATDIADNVTNSTSAFGAVAQDLVSYTGVGHASLIDPTVVTISEFEATGMMTAGTTVNFVIASSTAESVAINVGSKLVIRSTETPGDINAEGLITAYDDPSLTVSVTFSVPVDGGLVTIETGPAITFDYGAVLTITDGPNQARYTAREKQGVGTTCSFEMLLDRSLPVPKTGSTISDFGLTFGLSYVAFSSPTQSTGARVAIDNGSTGTAATLFFDATQLPAAGTGETVYLQFDTYPTGAAVGDLVQLFEDQYNLVSREFSIVGTEPGLRVLKLSSSLENSFNMTFDPGVPNPFGAIRISQTANYSDFKALLDTWLLLPELTTQYYRDLARFLNPVLTSSNPTSSDVDSAVTQLKKLSAVLSIAGATAYGSVHVPAITPGASLEFALNGYESPVEPAVDALISTFRNKGADRAVDLLLEGQFSTFFGLDLNSVSYSGQLMSSVSAVAMNDLPIRKTNRSNALGQQLIGTIPNQPNYEFDTSDADSTNLPDPPAAPDVAIPGNSF